MLAKFGSFFVIALFQSALLLTVTFLCVQSESEATSSVLLLIYCMQFGACFCRMLGVFSSKSHLSRMVFSVLIVILCSLVITAAIAPTLAGLNGVKRKYGHPAARGSLQNQFDVLVEITIQPVQHQSLDQIGWIGNVSAARQKTPTNCVVGLAAT